MKNSIGKPCEGKLHARFDEGGADKSTLVLSLMIKTIVGLSGSTLRCNVKRHSRKQRK